MHIIDFTDPQYRELVEQKIRSGDEGLYETVCLRKDGTTFSSEIQSQSYVLWWAYH
ncbi:multi-sensor signal transduction histidine kinase [Kalymmatonema gypsitolerans NIES-4073]|nr:multi-sensor signal transduction histidine kinase [Scytonema sp. NIES-4073]